MTILRTITYCCLFGFTALASSSIPNTKTTEQQANIIIEKLYHSINNKPNKSIASRIDWFSSQFKGVHYILGSLGEGNKGQYDQYPLYRMDGFDCDTYVNTILALALSNSLSSFQDCINKLRYKNGQVAYTSRNHFTSIDWNKNNQIQGVLQDITNKIKDKDKKPVAKYAIAEINKPNWYAHKTISSIRLYSASPQAQTDRLSELKTKGNKLEVTQSKIAYLPFSALFINKKPNYYLFDQIPNASVIEIVRPNWNLRKEIGTALNVSHLGFAIWKQHTLYFRQASSQLGKVADVPLIDYLAEATKSPTIKGINIQVILPQGVEVCRKGNN